MQLKISTEAKKQYFYKPFGIWVLLCIFQILFLNFIIRWLLVCFLRTQTSKISWKWCISACKDSPLPVPERAWKRKNDWQLTFASIGFDWRIARLSRLLLRIDMVFKKFRKNIWGCSKSEEFFLLGPSSCVYLAKNSLFEGPKGVTGAMRAWKRKNDC